MLVGALFVHWWRIPQGRTKDGRREEGEEYKDAERAHPMKRRIPFVCFSWHVAPSCRVDLCLSRKTQIETSFCTTLCIVRTQSEIVGSDN